MTSVSSSGSSRSESAVHPATSHSITVSWRRSGDWVLVMEATRWMQPAARRVLAQAPYPCASAGHHTDTRVANVPSPYLLPPRLAPPPTMRPARPIANLIANTGVVPRLAVTHRREVEARSRSGRANGDAIGSGRPDGMHGALWRRLRGM